VNINKKRTTLILISLFLTFIILRVYLHLYPGTNFDVGEYNIHHLYTGLLLITVGGLPLAIFTGTSRILDFAAITFGIGLSMALDEWVYLIATDGSDASYLLPVSYWGGAIMVGLAILYVFMMIMMTRRYGSDNEKSI